MGWWAVYSQAGRALGARDELAARGLAVFCPVEQLTRRRKIANRNKYRLERLVSPVFGRYLFARGDQAEVRDCRFVSDLVRAGLDALLVQDRVIDSLRELTCLVDGVGDLMGSRDVSKLKSGFGGAVGDPFKFTSGIFTGHYGFIAALDKLDSRGVVDAEVAIFGRTSRVEVNRLDMTVLSKAEARRFLAA